MYKRQAFLQDYITSCVRLGHQCDAPVISDSWTYRWRLEYGVCFRRPNRKWKVPWSVLKERLVIAWLNTFRVRQLALRVLGYDLDADNIDQSPFHVNEAGSQNSAGLSIRGCGVVPLKENHAATRCRYTFMTHCVSDRERARAIPPCELMFKGGDLTAQRLQQHIPPWAPWMTIVSAPKGSYREDDVLNYIDNMEAWSEQRRWRLLFLDAYSAHLSDRVRRAAWHKGYVVVTHGGGASAVTQVNDTDNHGPLKRQYVETEQAHICLLYTSPSPRD